MDYIQQMRDMRNALHLISEKVPALMAIIEDMKTDRNPDPDLNVLTMPDREFEIMTSAWDEIHEKITNFDHEWEYGKVETMDKSEMRGDPK